jgi:hypothetical protein
MKASRIAASIAVCFVAAALSWAAADGFTGTWKLNEAKSKLSPGLPKNSTVVYGSVGDSVKVTIDGTDSAGKPTHNEWTGKFDGKDYPVTGDANTDSRALTSVDANTITFVAKKNGKVTISGRIALSADGKTRTVTTNTTDSAGKKVTGVAVYDKQ